MRLTVPCLFGLEGLAGYEEYLKKVRWRLIPYIW